MPMSVHHNILSFMSKLYLVPTPVGNMKDMTPRGIEILRDADLILAEDTRTSSHLLKSLDISTPMMSYHMFNEHKTVEGFIDRIKAGTTIALITDAGTPGISDPGFLITREAIAEGIKVECLPGATAFVPALVASGLPCERFTFEGFLPVKKGRATRLEELKDERRTMIFYESPHKLLRTLEDFSRVFPARNMCTSREISKMYEEHIRGTVEEVLEHFRSHAPRGEFVLVVAGDQSPKKEKKRINKDE